MSEALSENPRENVYLSRKNYLDPADPLEALILKYQRGDINAGSTLLKANEGLVAVVSYPFYIRNPEAKDLAVLQTGYSAFLQAAKSFGLQQPHASFSNYAIHVMNDSFAEEDPWTARASFVNAFELPMSGVYHFLNTVKRVMTPEEKEIIARKNERRKQEIERRRMGALAAAALRAEEDDPAF